MFSSNIWPNSAPLQDKASKVKCDVVIGLSTYGFILIDSSRVAILDTLNNTIAKHVLFESQWSFYGITYLQIVRVLPWKHRRKQRGNTVIMMQPSVSFLTACRGISLPADHSKSLFACLMYSQLPVYCWRYECLTSACIHAQFSSPQLHSHSMIKQYQNQVLHCNGVWVRV